MQSGVTGLVIQQLQVLHLHSPYPWEGPSFKLRMPLTAIAWRQGGLDQAAIRSSIVGKKKKLSVQAIGAIPSFWVLRNGTSSSGHPCLVTQRYNRYKGMAVPRNSKTS